MDMLINTSTGDYTGTRSQGLENPVYLRLMTPLGSYWADPLLGSRLHELQREKDVTRVFKLAQQYAERYQPGWLLLLITVIEATGTEVTFKHPVRVI